MHHRHVGGDEADRLDRTGQPAAVQHRAEQVLVGGDAVGLAAPGAIEGDVVGVVGEVGMVGDGVTAAPGVEHAVDDRPDLLVVLRPCSSIGRPAHGQPPPYAASSRILARRFCGTTERGSQVRLRLPPQAARAEGPPRTRPRRSNQWREAQRSARPHNSIPRCGYQLGRCRHARPPGRRDLLGCRPASARHVTAPPRRLRALRRGQGPVRSARRSGGGRRRGPRCEPRRQRRRP